MWKLRIYYTHNKQVIVFFSVSGSIYYVLVYLCFLIIHTPISSPGHAVAQLVEALQARNSRVQLLLMSLEFFIDIILPAVLWPRG
jgi:hypothetical protein